MTQQLPPRRFTPCTETATDHPVLLIDSKAPLLDLHACLRERLNAALEHLNLMACSSLPDFAERDLNNVANTARILVQDVSDVFRVIEIPWSRYFLGKLNNKPHSCGFSASKNRPAAFTSYQNYTLKIRTEISPIAKNYK